MEEKNKRVIIVSIVALAIVIITASYAYFSARITGLENASTISMNAGTLGIHYAEGDENVTVSNIYPKEEAWVTKTFTLTGNNTTDLEMKYTLGLNVEANTFPDNYLTYDLKVLEQTGGTPVTEKTNAPINGTGLKKFGNGTFVTGQNKIHKYELKIYFKDNGLDQNDAQGAIFNAKISVTEYTPKKGTLLSITSYDINKTNCLTYAANKFSLEEDREAYCNGEVIGGTPYNMDDEVRQVSSDLINDNVIENVVRDGNNNITSYTINKENCLSYANNYYSNLSEEDKNSFCSGETVKLSDPVSPTTSIDQDISNGKGDELKNAGVIENVVESAKELAVGDKYIDGQYTYIYGQSISYNRFGISYTLLDNPDSWSVILTDVLQNSGQSTEPVTTELCTSINDKPITSMAYMFYNSQATSIDLSSFDTLNVTSMAGMFRYSKATTLDLSKFDTSNVTNMSYMFAYSQATSLDLSALDMFNVTTAEYMFNGQDTVTLENKDLTKITSTNMFVGVKNIDLSGSSINNFNILKVGNPVYYSDTVETLDLSNTNLSGISTMQNLFHMDGSSHNWENLKRVSFKNAYAPDVDSLREMFRGWSGTKIETIDLSNMQIPSVTNMNNMFYESKATTIDLSGIDTSNVTDMYRMFAGAYNLKTIYASDRFVTTNLTTDTEMFKGSTNLVGGAGTTYDSSKVDKTYARIDGGTSSPGYFTDIKDKPGN